MKTKKTKPKERIGWVLFCRDDPDQCGDYIYQTKVDAMDCADLCDYAVRVRIVPVAKKARKVKP